MKIEKQIRSWWGIIISGLILGLISHPLNGDTHWALAPIPLLSIVALIPFISLGDTEKRKTRFLSLWLWGAAATFGRVYWLTNVTLEGKYLLILLATVLLSGFLGLWYTVVGMTIHKIRSQFPTAWLVLFPSLWVISDFLKTVGELSFPWMMQGYLFDSYLSFSQIASVTGVWGITWIALFATAILYRRFVDKQPAVHFEIGAAVIVCAISIWGYVRIKTSDHSPVASVALIQSNIDHKNWNGAKSLLESIEITDTMIQSVNSDSVDLIILPESGLYTYLDKNWNAKRQTMRWVHSTKTPLMVGTLDKVKQDSSKTNYYNTAFLLRKGATEYEKYYKMKLVPVSEGVPYGWKFPILSRVAIVSGFDRGFDPVRWDITDSFAIAPTICYEAIYPNFNRQRGRDVDALVNVTNDSWFGNSTGPYQHASMARMRAIETGIPVVRCAASGVSFITNSVGEFVAKSSLGTKEVIVGSVLSKKEWTLYEKFGDWFVALCGIFVVTMIVRNRIETPRL